MNENHFSYFKVENFKRFKSFEMDNIGQFNLIVGDNNVGKTSVLESLLIDTDLNNYYYRLCTALSFKEIIEAYDSRKNYFKHYYNTENENNISYEFKKGRENINTIKIKLKEKKDYNDSEELESIKSQITLHPHLNFFLEGIINGKKKVELLDFVSLLNIGGKITHCPFISYGLGYSEDLINYYSNNIQQSNKLSSEFKKNLELFIPNIENVEISKDVDVDLLSIRMKEVDKLIPLAQFGEGTNKLFRILLEIIENKSSNFFQLMIDEIDTGIHHRRFIPFLKTVIKAAKENNVQIFATTHNLECLKFFRDVFLEEEMEYLQKDARVFRLVEHNNKKVSAYCYNFEAFDHAIENENELR